MTSQSEIDLPTDIRPSTPMGTPTSALRHRLPECLTSEPGAWWSFQVDTWAVAFPGHDNLKRLCFKLERDPLHLMLAGEQLLAAA